MENMELIEIIVKCVFTIIGALVTTVLVPYIKAKLGEAKLAMITDWVNRFVRAAEQLFPEIGSGEVKKQYVIEGLSKLFPNLTEEQIEALIEDAVLALNADVVKVHEDDYDDLDDLFADDEDDGK